MNTADDIICHAPGDRCHGCDHYHGKAPECKYKGERTMDERASDEYHSILITYIRELNKAHKGIRRLVRRNRKLEAAFLSLQRMLDEHDDSAYKLLSNADERLAELEAHLNEVLRTVVAEEKQFDSNSKAFHVLCSIEDTILKRGQHD